MIRPADLLVRCLRGESLELRAVLRQPLLVPETTRLLQLITQLRQADIGTAIVLDEFGGVEGTATLDDVLADLVADLPGGSAAEQEIVRRPDGSWLVDGAVSLDQLEDELDLPRTHTEGRPGCRTVAGLVMAELGRVPGVGERLERDGYTFEVVDMDGRRIDRVLITRVR